MLAQVVYLLHTEQDWGSYLEQGHHILKWLLHYEGEQYGAPLRVMK